MYQKIVLAKYADIDKNIKHLELRLKEGSSRDLGQNKVASITEKLVPKNGDELESKPVQRSVSIYCFLLLLQSFIYLLIFLELSGHASNTRRFRVLSFLFKKGIPYGKIISRRKVFPSWLFPVIT